MEHLKINYSIVHPLKVHLTNKFGMVYLAQEKKTGEYVVLKILEKKDASQVAIDRLKAEARFDFKFEGLPSIIELIDTADSLALVKRYEEGVPLTAFWKNVRGKDRLKQLDAIIAALLPLFDYLEKHGIVHCDIKPSNVLILEKNGSLVASLIDFGLALKLDEFTPRKILFPLGYAAPELVLNQLHLVNHQADLFALGITIWRLFTGKLPLTHPNPSIYTNLQLTHPLPDDTNLPKGLYPLLLKLSNKHVFRTAPNQLAREELEACLLQGQRLRYNSLLEFHTELTALAASKDKRWWNFL